MAVLIIQSGGIFKTIGTSLTFTVANASIGDILFLGIESDVTTTVSITGPTGINTWSFIRDGGSFRVFTCTVTTPIVSAVITVNTAASCQSNLIWYQFGGAGSYSLGSFLVTSNILANPSINTTMAAGMYFMFTTCNQTQATGVVANNPINLGNSGPAINTSYLYSAYPSAENITAMTAYVGNITFLSSTPILAQMIAVYPAIARDWNAVVNVTLSDPNHGLINSSVFFNPGSTKTVSLTAFTINSNAYVSMGGIVLPDLIGAGNNSPVTKFVYQGSYPFSFVGLIRSLPIGQGISGNATYSDGTNSQTVSWSYVNSFGGTKPDKKNGLISINPSDIYSPSLNQVINSTVSGNAVEYPVNINGVVNVPIINNIAQVPNDTAVIMSQIAVLPTTSIACMFAQSVPDGTGYAVQYLHPDAIEVHYPITPGGFYAFVLQPDIYLDTGQNWNIPIYVAMSSTGGYDVTASDGSSNPNDTIVLSPQRLGVPVQTIAKSTIGVFNCSVTVNAVQPDPTILIITLTGSTFTQNISLRVHPRGYQSVGDPTGNPSIPYGSGGAGGGVFTDIFKRARLKR